MSTGSESKITSNAYRRYARWLILPVLLPVMLAPIGSFFFQPYWGPLTRVGGFLENDYGWNAPQEEFDSPLTNIVWNIKKYDRYYDVVVIGDSFSYDKKKGWQNYFTEATGLSVITLNHFIGTEKVVNSEIFRTNPPRFLVFESLESYSLERLADLRTLQSAKPLAFEASHVKKANSPDLHIQKSFVSRNVAVSVETRTGQTFDYLEKSIGRLFETPPTPKRLRAPWGGDKNKFKAYSLPLRSMNNPLFSSKINDQLLVYGLDIGKLTDAPFVRLAAEGAWQMKKSVEANGKTKVLMILFPDKLSVYAPYLVDSTVAPPSIIPQMASIYPYQIRLDKVFAKAVAGGVQDLYLPDDTHCGYMGYKLAAEQLVNAVRSSMQQPITIVKHRKQAVSGYLPALSSAHYSFSPG